MALSQIICRNQTGSSVDRHSHHFDCFPNARRPIGTNAAYEMKRIRHAPSWQLE
jgi:hypothetical protein